MRWRTEGSDGQEALFDADVERHLGRGEFRGMEFFHVRAQRIINTLPKTNLLPFRHTVNAYRGCSHACTYCFARPTHEYLDLDAGEGFERQIVVKVNAIERLRAELHPRRWSGEDIAMGTNTDPYQRCEGKYHLTQGLIGVLAEAGNGFSILTKSTLVVRDADLLAEASRRADVSVNLSIGTVDPEVWRATEPGTPHPRQRLEAVARLRAAGVRCGVLVAPVLPGLSDAAAQIDDVVAACVEAGASSISGGMIVYLKPAVKEVFLRHLAVTHPELVPRYEAMYPGTNGPRAVQARVRAQLAVSLARHRGASVPVPRRRPSIPPAAAAPDPLPVPEAPPRQLGLGFEGS